MISFQELAQVISIQKVMPEMFLLKVNSQDIASHAKPGQFAMVGCDSGYGRLVRRPISIHQVEGKTVSFLFAVVGTGTEWLAQRKRKDKIDLLGPMGNGFSILPESRNLLLLAGGMGVAPLNFLAENAQKDGYSVRLLTGARTVSLICPPELLPQNAECIAVTEDGTAGEKGLVTAFLPQYTEWADQVFACGPIPMYQAMSIQRQTLALKNHIQISLEVRMGCGLGFCYACTVGTRQGLKQVCKDGPVFNLEDVMWDEFQVGK